MLKRREGPYPVESRRRELQLFAKGTAALCEGNRSSSASCVHRTSLNQILGKIELSCVGLSTGIWRPVPLGKLPQVLGILESLSPREPQTEIPCSQSKTGRPSFSQFESSEFCTSHEPQPPHRVAPACSRLFFKKRKKEKRINRGLGGSTFLVELEFVGAAAAGLSISPVPCLTSRIGCCSLRQPLWSLLPTRGATGGPSDPKVVFQRDHPSPDLMEPRGRN